MTSAYVFLVQNREPKNKISYFRNYSRLSKGPRSRYDYRGADKSLARLGRKQAAPVKSVMNRVMDWFG